MKFDLLLPSIQELPVVNKPEQNRYFLDASYRLNIQSTVNL